MSVGGLLKTLRCVSSRTASAGGLRLLSGSSPHTVRVLYDGECPICVKEIKFLQFLHKNQAGRVDFVDISLLEYDGSRYGGVSYEMAMEEMTVIDEKNEFGANSLQRPKQNYKPLSYQVHRGVPAFAVMYKAVGLGWLAWFITLPLIRSLMDRAYTVFATNRLKWTGREKCTTRRCAK